MKSNSCGPERRKKKKKKHNLLGRGSAGALPGKQDTADSCPVAVDAQESERQGDLGDERAASLNQEVDEEQAERGQQGQDRLMFGADKQIQKKKKSET